MLNTRRTTKQKISHQIEERERVNTDPPARMRMRRRENTHLDVEVFGVVEHGLECLGLEGHIDLDFLDLAKVGGFYVREGGIQCCL